jgi:hypothetical protein
MLKSGRAVGELLASVLLVKVAPADDRLDMSTLVNNRL